MRLPTFLLERINRQTAGAAQIGKFFLFPEKVKHNFGTTAAYLSRSVGISSNVISRRKSPPGGMAVLDRTRVDQFEGEKLKSERLEVETEFDESKRN